MSDKHSKVKLIFKLYARKKIEGDTLLVAESEHNIEEEQNSIDDGQ